METTEQQPAELTKDVIANALRQATSDQVPPPKLPQIAIPQPGCVHLDYESCALYHARLEVDMAALGKLPGYVRVRGETTGPFSFSINFRRA